MPTMTEPTTTFPCLECRRPLTRPVALNGGRALYVCDGHPPAVHRAIRLRLHVLECLGYRLEDRFGTVRCPGCGTSSTLEGVHALDGDECRLMVAERDAKNADD